jgi:uncharacterized coiled-coil DUF342 family protein
LEEEPKALNENVEIENNTPESPTEEKTTEEAVEPDQVTTEETEEEPKKGYSQRVRELNARAKEAEAKAESLAAKLKSLTEPQEQVTPEQPVYEPLFKPGEELDATELDQRLRDREARLLQRADALVTLRGKQQEAVMRINREADEAIKEYPELDPRSDNFNKELSEAISEATEAYVIKNPYTASVSTFVKKMMNPYRGAVSKEVGNLKESVVKQVSEAALRPTSVREKEKPAKDLTIAELEAKLGVVQA